MSSSDEPGPDVDADDVLTRQRELAAEIESIVATSAPADISPEFAQALLRWGVEAYFLKRNSGADFGPFADEQAVSATKVMVAASNMLQAADVDVFELGLWKNLTGS